jgi:hypothetical protein
MDKGFNDDELADIMNEIESLEKEFTEEITPEETVAAAEPQVEEVESEPMMEVEETVEAVQEEAVRDEIETIEASQDEIVAQEVEEVQEIDTEMTDVVEELSTMPVEDLEAVQATAHDDSNVHQIREVAPIEQAPVASAPTHTEKSGNFPESSLNFSVQGDMKLNLFFNIGGKSVQLNIKEEGFEIELDGGMKFSIPLNDSGATEKKAA